MAVQSLRIGRSTTSVSCPSARSVRLIRDVRWQRSNPHLWVGRGADGHVGTIEQYDRYWATDRDGTTYGYFDSLDDAADALHDPAVAPRLELITLQRRRDLITGSLITIIASTAVALAALDWMALAH